MSEQKRIQVTGLWEKEMKDGSVLFSGMSILGKEEEEIDEIQGRIAEGWSFVAFPNGYKETEKQPDYILYLSPPYEKGDDKKKPAKKSYGKKSYGKKKRDEIPY